MHDFTISFTMPPPDRPWSTNEDRNLHPQARAKLISNWKSGVWLIARSQTTKGLNNYPEPLFTFGIVSIIIPFAQKRTRDPHNYCGTVLKATIDGLVKARWFEDDDPSHVGHREPQLGTDRATFVVSVEGKTKRPIMTMASKGTP